MRNVLKDYSSYDELPIIMDSDYYKQAHAEQYPEGTAYLRSYATARMTRIPEDNSLIVFGIQAFIKRFLIEKFNKTFFSKPFSEIEEVYKYVIGNTFPINYVNIEKFRKLHELGYLPIEVGCLPEGTRVPIRALSDLKSGECQVPFMYIENTHPDFAWLTEFLESLTSSEIWYPMCVANQADRYRKIVNEWYDKTGCNPETRKSAISEFGYRGGKGSEAPTLASSAFLTSFNKTATIPAIIYNAMYYNESIENGNIGSGMISTEHSVMCSNMAVDGEEKIFLEKLITVLYPDGNVSVVCDSWDYFNCVKNIIGSELREHVLSRNGTVFVRGDSGDPVDIICGSFKDKIIDVENISELDIAIENEVSKTVKNSDYISELKIYFKVDNDIFLAEVNLEMDAESNYETTTGEIESKEVTKVRLSDLEKGTVELLWDAFGGTVNKAGYKVLDSHVRAIYGDSITPARAKQIYKRLAYKGFAACNVALGAGSFTMNTNEKGELAPFTRDTYGIAVKATWCQHEDGSQYQLFKNPKTDGGAFKKSQKGLIQVSMTNGVIEAHDNFEKGTLPSQEQNYIKVVFRDGVFKEEVDLATVRDRLHNYSF